MNWFKIRIHEEQRAYTYVGSSPHTLEALLDQAARGLYVRLDNLVFMDRWTVKDWSAWDKRDIPSIVINPKVIISIIQLRADPRTIESQPPRHTRLVSSRGFGTGFLALAIYILAVGAADAFHWDRSIGSAGAVFVFATIGGELLFGRRTR